MFEIWCKQKLNYLSKNMKKGYLIVIVAQTAFILLSLMYAFVQKAEAERQFKIAQQQREVAERNAMRAEELRLELESACK
jgi:hypothetical protein